ncbi:MAG: acetyl-CoA carboxylase biotin carboxylase subunit, partial [Victivallales bacterium]|nr:acetyl-CoA carboxylase biotin carboxylase subunit [Victivallales bacterium]
MRVIRACREMGLTSVVAYSEADRHSLPVMMADHAICIGAGPASESYLKIDRLIAAAELCGATAIHPGYGFLSENPHFADICEKCSIRFVGPSAEAIRVLGDKSQARALMAGAGVPVIPGSGKLSGVSDAKRAAAEIGYPVMLKATSGGGGKGMRVVKSEEEMEESFLAASSEARRAFAAGDLLVEKLLNHPKHVEIQIMADQAGHVVQLGDRDCSMQRRHQKVIEESPCLALGADIRRRMGAAAIQAARAANYVGAGTVEFLYDDGEFYFLEMNTRIQVEHPVTEMVTGIDLVREMIRIAGGEPLRIRQDEVRVSGHSIEVRINAEDPARNFLPNPGTVNALCVPGGDGVRFDSMLYQGYTVPPFYDSLLGKLIVHDKDRPSAIRRLERALAELNVEGIFTTKPLHQALARDADVKAGRFHTAWLEPWLESHAAGLEAYKEDLAAARLKSAYRRITFPGGHLAVKILVPYALLVQYGPH